MKPTLRLKIVSGFLVATVATLVLGVVAASLLASVKERAEISARTSVDRVSEVADIQAAFLESQGNATLSTYGPEEIRAEARGVFLEGNAQATDRFLGFARHDLSPTTRAAYDRVTKSVSFFNRIYNDMNGLNLPVPDPSVPGLESLKSLADYNARQAEFRDSLADLRSAIDADATASRNEANAAADRDLRLLLISLGVVGVALTGFAVWVSGRLVKRLRATVKVLQQVADGDLTARAAVVGQDEVGDMAAALNTSVSTMHDVLCQIGEDAETLATVARETRSHGDRVAGSPAPDGQGAPTATVTMDASEDNATKLAGMAENLNDVLGIFVLDRQPVAH